MFMYIIFMYLQWPSHSLFKRQSTLQAIIQRVIVHSDALRPLQQRLRNIIQGERKARAFITCLHRQCCPDAIVWRIPFRVSHSLDSVFRPWARPHIFIKIDERVLPSCTDSNPATTVICITRAARVQASCLHVFPYKVFRSVCHAMRSTTLRILLNLKTSAAFGCTSAQSLRIDNAQSTAAALTHPTCPTITPIGRTAQDGQSIKELFSQINEIMGSHAASLQAQKDGWLGPVWVRPNRITLARQPSLLSIAQEYAQCLS